MDNLKNENNKLKEMIKYLKNEMTKKEIENNYLKHCIYTRPHIR